MNENELTEDQKSQMEIYKNKWIQIGLDTRACNKKQAEDCAKDIYKAVNIPYPKNVHWFNSPWEAINFVHDTYKRDYFEIINNFCYGQHEASWLSFYDFFSKVCHLKKECEPILPFFDLAENCGWWLPYDEVIVFCERPEEVNLIENGKIHCIKNSLPTSPIINGRLHKDGGAAILYRDGFKEWALNGVRVSQEIAETPAANLDPHLVLKTPNAEVCREIVRKMGIERILKELNSKIIDTQDDYELLLLDMRDNRMRPYLKMVNPSIGVYHVEGVPPNTKTVADALKWRNGSEEKPTIVT